MGEAGLGGADQEFRFGHIKFKMSITHTQEYAEMAA